MRKIITLLLVLLVSACSSHYESVKAVDTMAYLQLSGNFLETKLIVDNGPEINLTSSNTKTFTIDGKLVAKFPLSKGKHQIIVIKQGRKVVLRDIYLSSNVTFEVIVP